MRTAVTILFSLCSWLANAQPSFPPSTTRVFVWDQPVTNNVTSYVITWGTNSLQIFGHTNKIATLKLDEGINTVIIRSLNGDVLSGPVTNVVRMINYDFESSTNGGASWRVRTNFTYAIENYNRSELFRAKLNWLLP